MSVTGAVTWRCPRIRSLGAPAPTARGGKVARRGRVQRELCLSSNRGMTFQRGSRESKPCNVTAFVNRRAVFVGLAALEVNDLSADPAVIGRA